MQPLYFLGLKAQQLAAAQLGVAVATQQHLVLMRQLLNVVQGLGHGFLGKPEHCAVVARRPLRMALCGTGLACRQGGVLRCKPDALANQ